MVIKCNSPDIKRFGKAASVHHSYIGYLMLLRNLPDPANKSIQMSTVAI